MSGEVQRLKEYCQKWGGDLVPLDAEAFRKKTTGREIYVGRNIISRFHGAPDIYASIDWPCRIIYCQKRHYCDKYWPQLLHEVAHTFCTTDSPEFSDDMSFLGWEFQLACRVGSARQWMKNQANLPDGCYEFLPKKYDGWDFNTLPLRLRKKILAWAVKDAEQRGLLDDQGNPIPAVRHLSLAQVRRDLLRRIDNLRKVVQVNETRSIASMNGHHIEQLFESRGRLTGYMDAVQDIMDILLSVAQYPTEHIEELYDERRANKGPRHQSPQGHPKVVPQRNGG